MTRLLRTPWTTKIVGISLSILLAACSGNSKDHRQSNDNESYLETTALKALNAPQGVVLPQPSEEFAIPAVKTEGAVGKAVDIFPPKQNIEASTSSAASASALTDSSMNVQANSDETGLPRLIVRTPYTALWELLPKALPLAGMEIKDRNGQNSTIDVKYSEPAASVWQQLGAKNPNLPNGNYKLQLGDLDNRVSIQLFDSKGQVVSKAQNEALVDVLQAALKQSKK